MVQLELQRALKNEIGRYIIRGYRNGYVSAMKERGVKKAAVPRSMVDLDADAKDHLRVLHEGVSASSGFYQGFGSSLAKKIEIIISEAFVENQTLSSIVNNIIAKIDKALNLSVGEVTRIARTELINVTNEGRLKAYQRREKELGESFRYKLIVARGMRTCAAHKELDRKIPKRGLPLNELVDLQMKIGKKHGHKLHGNFLLHPNQRTVMVRAV